MTAITGPDGTTTAEHTFVGEDTATAVAKGAASAVFTVYGADGIALPAQGEGVVLDSVGPETGMTDKNAYLLAVDAKITAGDNFVGVGKTAYRYDKRAKAGGGDEYVASEIPVAALTEGTPDYFLQRQTGVANPVVTRIRALPLTPAQKAAVYQDSHRTFGANHTAATAEIDTRATQYTAYQAQHARLSRPGGALAPGETHLENPFAGVQDDDAPKNRLLERVPAADQARVAELFDKQTKGMPPEARLRYVNEFGNKQGAELTRALDERSAEMTIGDFKAAQERLATPAGQVARVKELLGDDAAAEADRIIKAGSAPGASPKDKERAAALQKELRGLNSGSAEAKKKFAKEYGLPVSDELRGAADKAGGNVFNDYVAPIMKGTKDVVEFPGAIGEAVYSFGGLFGMQKPSEVRAKREALAKELLAKLDKKEADLKAHSDTRSKGADEFFKGRMQAHEQKLAAAADKGARAAMAPGMTAGTQPGGPQGQGQGSTNMLARADAGQPPTGPDGEQDDRQRKLAARAKAERDQRSIERSGVA